MSDSKQQEWFVTERARALALVHLTRRDDLTVVAAGREVGLDLIVYLKAERSLRQLGVFLRGTRLAPGSLDDALRPTMRTLARAGEYPFPVVLFHFEMDGDRAHFTWVAEPDAAGAEPRLVLHDEPHCEVLDRAALDRIVARVGGWYDAFFGRVAVKAS
ncbi:MAG: hypothetical protein ACRC33_04360 [Gemmataceae bacterium]